MELGDWMAMRGTVAGKGPPGVTGTSLGECRGEEEVRERKCSLGSPGLEVSVGHPGGPPPAQETQGA